MLWVWVESGMAGQKEKSLTVIVHGVALGGRGWLQQRWGWSGFLGEAREWKAPPLALSKWEPGQVRRGTGLLVVKLRPVRVVL